MQNELEQKLKIPKAGDIVDGKVLAIENLCIFLDIGPGKTGVVYGAEYQGAKNILKSLKIGDSINVKVVDSENEDGFVELSLKEAARELAWNKIKDIKEEEKSFLVKIEKVNKGGLLTSVSGVPAFLPTSQLSAENYPKVPEGDRSKILRKLQEFIGKEIEVKILDFDEKDSQVILTEASLVAKATETIIAKIEKGEVVEGEISGIVSFGAFMKFEFKGQELEGLIHISELDWQLIEDPANVIELGQKVKAEVIDVTNGRISLSMKKLKQDPWKELDYKVGDTLKGKVLKINTFGAFVQVLRDDNSKIQGLIHVSEFGTEKKMKEDLGIGSEYDFKILSFQPERHWMSLKLTKN